MVKLAMSATQASLKTSRQVPRLVKNLRSDERWSHLSTVALFCILNHSPALFGVGDKSNESRIVAERFEVVFILQAQSQAWLKTMIDGVMQK